jgi:hypothetical protein
MIAVNAHSRTRFFVFAILAAFGPYCDAADIINVEELVNPSSFGGTIVAVSADGTTVVGTKGLLGFRWRQESGVEYFGNNIVRLNVRAVSDSGSKVYVQGNAPSGNPKVGYWSQGMSEVFYPPFNLNISSETIIGASGESWYGQVTTTGFGRGRASIDGRNLGFLPQAQNGYSIALGPGGVGEANISDNNSIVHAFGPGGFDLGVLPGGTNSRAFSMANGVTIGESESSDGLRAFIITPTNRTMQSLGVLPGATESSARSISPDGYWIFGTSGRSFIWDSNNGMRDLMQVLIDSGVHGIENWTSIDAPATVSGDSVNGYVLTGTGSNGRYIIRGLFAVPEPHFRNLVGVASILLMLARRMTTNKYTCESRTTT